MQNIVQKWIAQVLKNKELSSAIKIQKEKRFFYVFELNRCNNDLQLKLQKTLGHRTTVFRSELPRDLFEI